MIAATDFLTNAALAYVSVAALGGVFGLHEAAARLYCALRRLWLSSGAHLASWLCGTLEIWAPLHLLGAEPGLAKTLVIESLGQAVRNADFVVPTASACRRAVS